MVYTLDEDEGFDHGTMLLAAAGGWLFEGCGEQFAPTQPSFTLPVTPWKGIGSAGRLLTELRSIEEVRAASESPL